MASTLQEQLAAKKKAQLEAAAKAEGKLNIQLDTQTAEAQAEQALKATQAVAAEAGTVQTPGPGSVQTGIQSSIVQSGASTDAEKQTERSEVDTHLTIVEDPRGSDTGAPNPPNGTLPNSHLVYNGEPGSVMAVHHDAMQAGLAQNKLSEEEEARIQALADGEARRQRMLSGFQTAEDLALQQEEANKPEGGWKATGINRIFLHNGTAFSAVNGYFVPETEEQEEHLKYFLEKGLVEAP